MTLIQDTHDHYAGAQLTFVQVDFASMYNRNATKLILIEVQKEHGQSAVNQLFIEINLHTLFGFKPETLFTF